MSFQFSTVKTLLVFVTWLRLGFQFHCCSKVHKSSCLTYGSGYKIRNQLNLEKIDLIRMNKLTNNLHIIVISGESRKQLYFLQFWYKQVLKELSRYHEAVNLIGIGLFLATNAATTQIHNNKMQN